MDGILLGPALGRSSFSLSRLMSKAVGYIIVRTYGLNGALKLLGTISATGVRSLLNAIGTDVIIVSPPPAF